MLGRSSLSLALLALVATSVVAAAIAVGPRVAPVTISAVDPNGGEPQVFLESSGALLVGDAGGIFRSTDGGATWTDVTPAFFHGGGCGLSSPVPSAVCDGWVIAQDSAGKLYASTTNGPQINLATSTDHGVTWNLAANLAAGVDAVADRPWLATGGANKVAVIWNTNGQWTSCALSTDGGLTFVRGVTNVAGVIAGSAQFDSLGNLDFAIPGTVYKWGSPCLGSISSTNLPAHGQGGLQQQTVVDSSNRWYTPQPASGSNAPIQIVGINGWGGTVKTVSAAITGVNSVTMPAITEKNGQIAVSFYGSSSSGDPSNVPASATWNVYLVRITNFWTTSPTITTTKVTTSSVHSGPICLDGINCSGGRELWDYQSVAIDSAGAVHMAWTHDPLGTTYAKVP